MVVKLSGEALMGGSQFGIDAATLGFMAKQVERVVANHHVEVAIGQDGRYRALDRGVARYVKVYDLECGVHLRRPRA